MQSQQRNRRVRVPLSCDPCRARKLKCNREWPCQNCSARNEHATAVASCKFRGVAAKPETAGALAPSNRYAGGDDSLRQRIKGLEDMVKRLIESQSQSRISTHTSSTQSSNGVYAPESARLVAEAGDDGRTVMDRDGHSVYHGGDALYAILEEINELEDHIVDGGSYPVISSPVISSTVDGPSLLFMQPKPIERMISGLPPKHQVDALVSHFFTLILQASPLGVPPILHQPTFMRDYNENWKNLSRTSFIWLGLLFSMLGVSMLAYREYGEPPEYEGKSEALLHLYRKRAAQCLQSGDIAKCLPYTVETLRLNAVAEGHRKDGNERGLWIMAGVIVRTAINMGYHREPSQAVPILQAEYRRRIWYSVISMDEIFSFLGGFPCMTPVRYSDTAEPRNLHDWELTEDMTVLPPSRPFSEPTSVTYQIVKSRLTQALGRIADYNWGQGSYESLVEIDRVLQSTYLAFPPQMKVAPMEDGDAVRTMNDWSNLSLLVNFLKGTCTLHRRSLTKARVDPRYSFSRDRCISSALEILALQQHLPSSLYTSSQARQIFTLGAMALFLELGLRKKVPGDNASPTNSVLLQALEKSCASWAKAAGAGCDETSRVHRFLARLLSGFRVDGADAPSAQTSQTGLLPVPGEEPAASTWLHMSNTEAFDFEKELSNVDFDWASWDAFIGEAGLEPSPGPGPGQAC